jgi:predicted nucleic acid-binding Zn finger protein
MFRLAVYLVKDRMLEKARKLMDSNRVEHLTEQTYNVIGDHGTYTVVQNYTGKFSCNCPGFLTKRRCSHVAAVRLLQESKRRKRRRPV